MYQHLTKSRKFAIISLLVMTIASFVTTAIAWSDYARTDPLVFCLSSIASSTAAFPVIPTGKDISTVCPAGTDIFITRVFKVR